MIQDFQNHKQFSLTSSLLRTEKYRRNMFFGVKKRNLLQNIQLTICINIQDISNNTIVFSKYDKSFLNYFTNNKTRKKKLRTHTHIFLKKKERAQIYQKKNIHKKNQETHKQRSTKAHEICRDLKRGHQFAKEMDLAIQDLNIKIRVCTRLPVANLLESGVNILLKTAQLVELQTVQIFTHPLPKHTNQASKLTKRCELLNSPVLLRNPHEKPKRRKRKVMYPVLT